MKEQKNISREERILKDYGYWDADCKNEVAVEMLKVYAKESKLRTFKLVVILITLIILFMLIP